MPLYTPSTATTPTPEVFCTIRPISGQWYALGYQPSGVIGAASGNNLGEAGYCWFAPFVVTEACTLDRIAVCAHSNGTDTVVRFGIYGDDGYSRPTGAPTDFGQATIAGSPTSVTISHAVTANTIWHAAMAINSLTSVANFKISYPPLRVGVPTAVPDTAANGTGSEWYATGVTGALPSSPSLTELNKGDGNLSKFHAPIIFVRVA